MRLNYLLAMFALLTLSACNQKARLECTSASASEATISTLKAEIEKDIAKGSSTATQPSLSASAVRATLSKLVFAIEEIRTTKEDPNSTKRFCSGKLTVKVPPEILDDAEQTISNVGQKSVSALAGEAGVDRDANAFSVSIDYNVQPTDDGSKVYAEIDNSAKLSDFFSGVVGASLLKNALEAARLQQQQTETAQQQQLAAANQEQEQADLAQARTENQLANQVIMAVWKNLPEDQRQTLLADQRAWVRKKVADCNVEAAGASTDPTAQDAARFRCDTRLTNERSHLLQGQDSGQDN